MEKSWDRLVARIAIESTCDAILARAEMRQTHTSTHTSPENDVPAHVLHLHTLCLEVERRAKARRTGHVSVPALVAHECPVRGCVQCDTLTFTRKVG